MVYDVLNVNIITDFVYKDMKNNISVKVTLKMFLNIDEILYFHWWRKETTEKTQM